MPRPVANRGTAIGRVARNGIQGFLRRFEMLLRFAQVHLRHLDSCGRVHILFDALDCEADVHRDRCAAVADFAGNSPRIPVRFMSMRSFLFVSVQLMTFRSRACRRLVPVSCWSMQARSCFRGLLEERSGSMDAVGRGGRGKRESLTRHARNAIWEPPGRQFPSMRHSADIGGTVGRVAGDGIQSFLHRFEVFFRFAQVHLRHFDPR